MPIIAPKHTSNREIVAGTRSWYRKNKPTFAERGPQGVGGIQSESGYYSSNSAIWIAFNAAPFLI